MIKKILLFALLLQPLYVAATHGADSRYSIHTSGLNSSVYVNMLYFANFVNQYATDFTLVTLPQQSPEPCADQTSTVHSQSRLHEPIHACRRSAERADRPADRSSVAHGRSPPWTGRCRGYSTHRIDAHPSVRCCAGWSRSEFGALLAVALFTRASAPPLYQISQPPCPEIMLLFAPSLTPT